METNINTNKTLMAFDVATTTGWAVMDNGKIVKTGLVKYKKPSQFFKEISDLLDLYTPRYVIAAAPTRFFTVIFKHGKLFGIIDLALDERDLEFWMDITPKGRPTLPIDSKIKKNVIGKGVVSKEEIMKFMKIDQEDEADAAMFVTYLFNNINN